jgi:hypothetical protein
VLEAHGVDNLARSEHVGFQRGKSRSKQGSIGFSHAVQKGSGEGTAGFGKIPVPCGLFPVDGDHGGGSIICMLCGHVPGRAGAVLRWVASGNPGKVGDVAGDHVPYNVGDHKAKSTSNVVLWTLVSGLGFDVLEPGLEVGSRVNGEGVGNGDCRVSLRHDGWVGGWVDGWMDGCKI